MSGSSSTIRTLAGRFIFFWVSSTPGFDSRVTDGQQDVEGGASPGALGDADLAALALDEGLDEVEAEAHARRGDLGAAAEAFEDVCHLAGRHPRPPVEDRDADHAPVAALARLQLHRAPAVVDPVVDAVDEDA